MIEKGNSDLFQLKNDKVRIFVPTKGMSQGEIYDRDKVIEDYDFSPSQVTDYKALVGDTSDNYPGVAGVGPKTAVELLRKFKGIDEIYTNLDEVDIKVRSKLEKGKKDAFFFKKIATVFSEVPIKFDFDGCKNWDFGSGGAVKFMEEMGFKSLLARVKKPVLAEKEISKNKLGSSQ